MVVTTIYIARHGVSFPYPQIYICFVCTVLGPVCVNTTTSNVNWIVCTSIRTITKCPGSYFHFINTETALD